MKDFAMTILTIFWLMGIAIAEGFWLTLLAFVVPPFGLYLTAAAIAEKYLL